MAISVGSVEVDVIPSTQGIYQRLRAGLVPAATRAGEDAGTAAGRAFGPAMAQGVSGATATAIGERLGEQIGQRLAARIRDSLRDGVTSGGRQAQAPATRSGNDAGGAFGRSFRARVEAAMRSLPDITIGANTTQADADIRALRVQLETLSQQRVGIDIDAETARAQIATLERELTRLGAEHPDIAVRINTGEAVAQLALLRAEINRLDGQDIDVRVDPSVRSFGLLVTAAAAFGPAILPVLPVVAAGLGAVAAAGVAAGVGLAGVGAVALPAFKQIAGVLQLQKAAQDASNVSTSTGSSKAYQLAGAQQALATAHRSAAQQIASARDQVVAAERAVGDAERALTQSQKDAKQAQQDLTAARRTAAQQLQDMSDQLADAQLSQRDATLQVQQAQQDLNKTRTDPKATQLQRQQAQLTYDQAVQHLKEQSTATSRLQAAQAKAVKAGVNGSDIVRQAQDKLAQSQQNVADKARAVSDAQKGVAKATEKVAEAQQSAADSIASAQRQIAQAQESSAGSASAAETAQEKYRKELAKLTPAARGTLNAFVSLRDAFSKWSKSLQPAVMPIFTRALVGLKNSLPGLTPFVLAAAKAIGELQDRASAGFKSPWWKTFKEDLAGSVEPAITGLGISFGRIFKGMVGIIDAFLPHMDDISTSMQRITGKFAAWGTGLRGSPEFERFLSYSSEQAPMLADTLGKLFGAVVRLGIALSPMAGTAQSFLDALTGGIQKVPIRLLTVIGVAFASIAIGAKLAALALGVWRGAVVVAGLVTAAFTGEVWALDAAMAANLVGLIVAAIIALVVAVIYAWQHWKWFRETVIAVWDAIKAVVLFAWNNVLKPTFDAIWGALQTIGRWATWLWQTILSPVFNFIATAARILFTAVVVLAILPIVFAFKVLAAVGKWLWETTLKPVFSAIAAAAMWLWKNVLSPVFGWIGDKAKWLWTNAIKPAFNSFKQGMVQVGDQAKWLWKNAISPVFGWIGDKGKWLWTNALKPQFDLMKAGVRLLGESFKSAVGFIDKQWSRVEGIAKKPVRFVIDKVYNGGIVPTWNKVATAFGAPKIQPMETKGWATGGVLPGYTPGRDVHHFASPTGGGLDLSGGEAIMRPEWTRAVGAGFVNTMNRIASSRGATGVKAALAPALGGNDITQRFAGGGIFDWIGKGASAIAGAGSAAWNGVKKGASWLKDGLESSARAGVRSVVNPLLSGFPGMETNYGKMIRKVPDSIINSLFGYSKKADKKGAGGLGGPRIQTALKWARAQAGKPYVWGGVGPAGFDCSGFMSAIENVVRGVSPNHRRWATGAFSGKTAPAGWSLNANSPFRIGITNAGVGHTAGTIGGVNVESRGGDGVVIGSAARGFNAPLFTGHYGFTGKYDDGGYLQPGMNFAYNGTGRPEPVFTTQQANALTGGGGSPGVGDIDVKVYVGNEEISHIARTEIETTLRPIAAQIAHRRG